MPLLHPPPFFPKSSLKYSLLARLHARNQRCASFLVGPQHTKDKHTHTLTRTCVHVHNCAHKGLHIVTSAHTTHFSDSFSHAHKQYNALTCTYLCALNDSSPTCAFSGSAPILDRIVQLLLDIAQGTLYLHDNQIIHGDLKVGRFSLACC